MNLAIVPARGGSTRLKGKATYPLGGKPLIHWTLNAVLDTDLFDRIILSSDSDNILKAGEMDGVTPHKRDPKFATTEIPVLELILHIAEEYKDNYETLTYLLPTCPFVKSGHIVEGMSLLDDRSSVVSVVQYGEPIQLAGRVSSNNMFIPYFSNLREGRTNSLFMTKYYRPNGAFYMANIDFLLKHRSFFKSKVKAVVMSKAESHDINDLLDIKMADAIIKEGLI
jgi:CMP-N,N'-diacetyllegionaminic acid synthase